MAPLLPRFGSLRTGIRARPLRAQANNSYRLDRECIARQRRMRAGAMEVLRSHLIRGRRAAIVFRFRHCPVFPPSAPDRLRRLA